LETIKTPVKTARAPSNILPLQLKHKLLYILQREEVHLLLGTYLHIILLSKHDTYTNDLILEDFLGNNASKDIFFFQITTPWIRDNGQIVSISAKAVFLIYIHVLELAIAVNPKWCGPCREMQTVAPSPFHHKIMLRGQRD
jgi:hypothetical protein